MKITGVKALLHSAPRKLVLTVDDQSVEAVREFLLERGRKGASEKPVEVSIEDWREKKTYDQCKLFWMLIHIMAVHLDGKFTEEMARHVYSGLIAMYAPRVKGYKVGEFVPKTLSQMNTVEASGLIEGAFRELAEAGFALEDSREAKELYDEWRTWRGKSKAEKFDERTLEEYAEAVPFCEACGSMDRVENAHIVSVGAGSPSGVAGYYLRLCFRHHREVQHQHGWETLLRYYPHLIGRVNLARKKEGKKKISLT